MKILIDARLYGLENAGLGRYLIKLIDNIQLLDKENEYTLLLRNNYYRELKLPKNWTKVLADFRHYSVKEQILLPGLIKKQNPDLVHFPHFNVPVFYKGPYVVTIHDLLMHSFKGKDATTLPSAIYLIKRLGYKYVFDHAISESDAIITPSEFVKTDLLRKYSVRKDKVFVTYEGVSVSKETKERPQQGILRKYGIDKPYFLYVGNAYPHKNLDRAIEATSFLKEKKKVKFAIATSRGVFEKRLREKIVNENLQEDVILLGYVPDEELAVLYKNSVSLLYPSLIEGFGLQGLEAMANETLVVASEIDVFKEVYGDAAIYFNPYDFSSIENAMRYTLELTPAQRKALLLKSKKILRKYSWKKMARETLSIYEKTIQRTSGYRLRQSK